MSTSEQLTILNQNNNKENNQANIEQISSNMLEIWNNAVPCTKHSYLAEKHLSEISEYLFKITKDYTLLIPVKLISGKIISLLRIYLDKNTSKHLKRLYAGLPSKDGICILGSIASSGKILLAEGIATAITIHKATKHPVICIFGKNFDNIGKIIKEHYPNNEIYYCCDIPGIGEKVTSEDNAKKAKFICGGKIYLPDFSIIPEQLNTHIPRSDFNDLFVLLLATGVSNDEALAIIAKQFNSNPIKHYKILDDLLSQIKPINYPEYASVNGNGDLKNKHYQIITVEQLIKISKSNNYGICHKHENIYLYNGEYWQLIEEESFKSFLGKVAEKLGVNQFDAKSYRFRDELHRQFLALAAAPSIARNENAVYINLKNGTFKITPDLVKLEAFDSQDFLTYQLPFEYDPNATSPLFNKFINEVIPEADKQLVLAEYLGYIFIKNKYLKREKALLLYGTGANGKSVLHDIITNLLGYDNVTSYSLQDITTDKNYCRAELANKLLNYASEISRRMETTSYKSIISGEPISARSIRKDPFIMRDYAKLMFNCNNLPASVEHNEAFFRRLIIIYFGVTFPENQQDPQLAQKIIQYELAGVFNWILAGLKRLIKQGQFTECESSNQIIEQYKIDSDSVKLFISENDYKPNPEKVISIKILYINYLTFCVDYGIKPIPKTDFMARLSSAKIIVKRVTKGNIAFLHKEREDTENN